MGSKPTQGGFRPNLLMIVGGLIVIAIIALIVLNINGIVTGLGNALTFVFTPNTRVDPTKVVVCRDDSTCSTIHAFVYSLILLLVVITGFAYTTLLERRFIAFFQARVGPNRVGPGGFLQPAADAVKLITKEDITPSGVSFAVWFMAPMIKVVPVLVVLAVIPLGPDILLPWFDGKWYQIPLGLVDINVGILWLLAITSIGTYGIVLAGWSSNNKYSMLGGLRSTAQMISYELSLGLTMAVPVMIVGSMSLVDITHGQPMIWNWFIFQNPLAAAVLFIALLAEISRSPFDLPEAEQELTAGFMTEYSGMKFALFMMGEYLGMIAVSMIASVLFLGGYQDGFGLVNNVPILGPLVMIGKIVLFLLFMIWIRATLPRIRYDRLMHFGWKVMLPLALVSVVWTAVALVLGDEFGGTTAYGIAAGILFVVVAAFGVLYLRRLGKEDGTEDDLVNDPIITGERRGLGWGALNVVGALLAGPFVLINFTINQLDKIAQLAPEPAKPAGPALTAPAATAALPPAVAPVAKVAAPVAEAKPAAEANPAAAAAPAAEAKPAAGGEKPKFDKQAMLAKIREKKANG